VKDVPASLDLLSSVLALVERRRHLDLTRYRRPTLSRRLANRMIAAGAASDEAYWRLLEDDPEEIDRLLTALTIKVSRFYRNAPVFDALRTTVIPELRHRAGAGALRVWSAGCANGEEAYTLALLAAPPAWIDATDIDEPALAAARAGRYPPASLAELPLELAGPLGDWTSAGAGGVTVDARLRARVRFSWHDVAQRSLPPPGGPYHLVCCRNVLIYLTPEAQRTATAVLVENLCPGGVLCLGEAEWPVGEHGAELEVIDRRTKLFRKRAEAGGSPR
jgi:chemotaxis methyl-accepting protein methylase